MAAITTSGSTGSGPEKGSAEVIRTAFNEHEQELTWLAGFLTGDEITATACVIDASSLAAGEDDIRQQRPLTWPREATIRSALEVQRARIALLSSIYDRQDCGVGEHASLPLETVEFVVSESDLIRKRLDTICRFVLVLCGFEHRYAPDVALLLGITEHAVDAAYCAALQFLDVIRSQDRVESYGHPAAWN